MCQSSPIYESLGGARSKGLNGVYVCVCCVLCADLKKNRYTNSNARYSTIILLEVREWIWMEMRMKSVHKMWYNIGHSHFQSWCCTLCGTSQYMRFISYSNNSLSVCVCFFFSLSGWTAKRPIFKRSKNSGAQVFEVEKVIASSKAFHSWYFM